ncbi:hypothetical protein JTB14_037537 [Gonioctena quinquepunctata]|nr:hypothetical protein JTB14_037537 [Gonioctena quinquepunctata]
MKNQILEGCTVEIECEDFSEVDVSRASTHHHDEETADGRNSQPTDNGNTYSLQTTNGGNGDYQISTDNEDYQPSTDDGVRYKLKMKIISRPCPKMMKIMCEPQRKIMMKTIDICLGM